MTSISVGTSTLVRSLNTGEKPCEKYRVYTSISNAKLNQNSPPPYLSLGQLWLYCRPSLTLGSITQKVHHNRALGDSFINLEKVGPGNPSIILSLFP